MKKYDFVEDTLWYKLASDLSYRIWDGISPEASNIFWAGVLSLEGQKILNDMVRGKVDAPIKAPSDDAAIFELLNELGCSMPKKEQEA